MPASCPTGGVRKPGYLSSNPSLAEGYSRGCELPDASNLSHMWAQHIQAAAAPLGAMGELEKAECKEDTKRHQKHQIKHDSHS